MNINRYKVKGIVTNITSTQYIVTTPVGAMIKGYWTDLPIDMYLFQGNTVAIIYSWSIGFKELVIRSIIKGEQS